MAYVLMPIIIALAWFMVRRHKQYNLPTIDAVNYALIKARDLSPVTNDCRCELLLGAAACSNSQIRCATCGRQWRTVLINNMLRWTAQP